MMRLIKRIRGVIRSDDGATSIEYAVMLGLICGALIASVGTLSDAMRDSFNSSGDAVNTALGGAS